MALDLLTKFIPAPVSIKYRLISVPDRTPMDRSFPVVACTRMTSLEVLVVLFPLLVPHSPCLYCSYAVAENFAGLPVENFGSNLRYVLFGCTRV